jgi:hypothetical protein
VLVGRPHPRQTPDDAAADVAYREAMLASGAVPMPRPIRTVAGQVLVDVAGYQVRAYEWVDLLAMDPDLDPAVVGATLAAIHQVHYAPPRCRSSRRGDHRATAPGSHDRAAYEPAELSSRLVGRHILPTPTAEVWVIDWENCGLADPAQELPMAMIDFAFGDQRRITELYLSYLETGGPTRVSGYGTFTMVIAQFSHFWELAVTAYISTNAAEDKAHSLDRIAELLNPPLRVAHLEEMLDTIASIR